MLLNFAYLSLFVKLKFLLEILIIFFLMYNGYLIVGWIRIEDQLLASVFFLEENEGEKRVGRISIYLRVGEPNSSLAQFLPLSKIFLPFEPIKKSYLSFPFEPIGLLSIEQWGCFHCW